MSPKRLLTEANAFVPPVVACTADKVDAVAMAVVGGLGASRARRCDPRAGIYRGLRVMDLKAAALDAAALAASLH